MPVEQDAKHTKLYDYLIIVPGDELARSVPAAPPPSLWLVFGLARVWLQIVLFIVLMMGFS